MNPITAAQPIEMPFGLRTPVGPRNHVLDMGPDRPKQMDTPDDNLPSAAQKQLNPARRRLGRGLKWDHKEAFDT